MQKSFGFYALVIQKDIMLGVKTTSWSSSPTEVNIKRDIPCTNSYHGQILVVGSFLMVCVGFWFFGCFFLVFISVCIHTVVPF